MFIAFDCRLHTCLLVYFQKHFQVSWVAFEITLKMDKNPFAIKCVDTGGKSLTHVSLHTLIQTDLQYQTFNQEVAQTSEQ
jgi:hypothetical protein